MKMRKDSDIVIITSGIARKPGQTRIELTQTNVNILKSITPQIVKEAPNALYIIVSNPVDIMTYVFTKISVIFRKTRSSVPELFWTQQRLRFGLLRTFPGGLRKIFTPMYSVSMEIPPLFPGPARMFPEQAWMIMRR